MALAATATGAGADDPEALASQLTGRDVHVRLEARQRLVALGVPALRPLFARFPAPDSAAASELRYVIATIALQAPRPSGDTDPVVDALRDVLVPASPLEARVLAVRLLGSRGREECVPLLAGRLDEPGLGEEARQALSQIPGERATRALADAAQHATGEWRITLLRTLGERRDAAALPVLRACTRDWDVGTVGAAIDALGRLESLDAAPYVRRGLASKSEDVRMAAARALLAIGDACRKRGQEREAVSLLREVLAPETEAAESDRIGALTALGRIGTAEVLPLAIPFLQQGSHRVRVAAAMAIHAVPLPEATRALAEALRGASLPLQYALVRVLGERRDPEAFPAISGLADTEDPGLRVQVLHAMGNTGDPRAASPLALALSDPSPEIQGAAVDANLRLGDALLSQGKPAEAAQAYHRVFDSQSGERERIAALDGMARAACPDSLERVRRVLAVGSQPLKGAAVAAAIGIATTLEARGQRQDAMQLFGEALERVPTGPRTAEVVRKMHTLGIQGDLAECQGFLSRWWILGPFSNADDEAWARKLPPEDGVDPRAEVVIDGRKLRWQLHHTEDPQGIVSYDRLFPEPDQKAAYAYAEFEVDEAQNASLKLGSDDSVVCWLNGGKVIERRASRGLKVDEESAAVRLQKGTNRLLLKVLNGTGAWASCARLLSADGRPLRFRSMAIGRE